MKINGFLKDDIPTPAGIEQHTRTQKSPRFGGLLLSIFQILESHLPKLVTHQLVSAASA
ncbi:MULTISPECIES: hypothetical protein [Burkholderia]|uniref:hypothetical protein n=1 Tax=Burkholderia TaxID=32008 RepID=UPI0014170F72|nr:MULTISPECIES: hypothetical protein [Burkholderia]MDP9544196.1 hypothetical protein [Burkholderia cepacia]MBR8394156.1 hypothetical protein [Burkholderia cenocepacia]MBR8471915.1 hypothetical protein [Burkholderia cenocepacia]MBR8487737.1 hypothetical protein [Burkholderia cenocepacia]MDO5917447.1 hypothetical protein [Burkholderia cenocepacia]